MQKMSDYTEEPWIEECQKAMEEVERYVNALLMLAHPSADMKKEILIACGDEAFACSIFPINKENKKELLQFWSLKWCNVVSNDTEPEKIALTVREKIKPFRSILNGSPEGTFFVDSPAFVESARNLQDGSHRISKYLVLATHLPSKYHRLPDRYKHQLDLLSKPLPINESQPSSVLSIIEWLINPDIDEYEICSVDEDERECDPESTELPKVTKDIISLDTRDLRHPPILRLDAPYVEELLRVLAKLPAA